MPKVCWADWLACHCYAIRDKSTSLSIISFLLTSKNFCVSAANLTKESNFEHLQFIKVYPTA